METNKHLTKENLESVANNLSNIIQANNIELKHKLPVDEHQKYYHYLSGVNYGVFLLMKYIERGVPQPFDEFIKQELKREFNK